MKNKVFGVLVRQVTGPIELTPQTYTTKRACRGDGGRLNRFPMGGSPERLAFEPQGCRGWGFQGWDSSCKEMLDSRWICLLKGTYLLELDDSGQCVERHQALPKDKAVCSQERRFVFVKTTLHFLHVK